ncbi:hypothetical protein Cni_G05322 [Canna indica]|uniref:Lysine ketoglutarate reductase trans-splicing related 1 n=1 Tax=Canna indica TaxID=4628 RepID=A0AAQ3Q348_9LILI|nr:hypothetical protein Cni_G05322 [Canna indica]
MTFTGLFWKMNSSNHGALLVDPLVRRLCFCSIFNAVLFFCTVFIVGTCFVAFDYNEKVSTGIPTDIVEITQRSNNLTKAHPPVPNLESTESNSCKGSCITSGSERLPKGIVSRTSDLEMVPLWGSPKAKRIPAAQKSLLAIPVGIKQKEIVNQIVTKFDTRDFAVMLFHYDGVVDEWRDLEWSGNALHIAAIDQTKWWFAKRFLHPDVVAPYKYIFLWDEDIGVDNFHPNKYLRIVEREGLEISQPALDLKKSQIHHWITARLSKGDVHRRMYKFNGGGRCYANSSGPPCTGWVEMMAPVFSRAAWRCVWHMIQNDLIHAWGLDKRLGYCAQGDRSKNVGVVDREYIVHMGLTTLGQLDEKNASPNSPTVRDRFAVRRRSYIESEIFRKRWKKAAEEDKCWINPYPDPESNSRR